MSSISRTRFFASNYPQLQGLRMIPFGLCLLAVTLWANIQQGPSQNITLPTLIVLACLGLYIFIARYYNRAYGKVRRLVPRVEWIIGVAGGGLALVAFILDSLDTYRISLLGLVYAVTFISHGAIYWRQAPALHIANLILALLMVASTLSPLVSIPTWWSLIGLNHPLFAATFLTSIFLMIIGVIGHIYFVRSLPAEQEAA